MRFKILNLPDHQVALIPDELGWYKNKTIDSIEDQISEIYDDSKSYLKCHKLKPGMNLLDLGAYIGLFSLRAAKIVYPGKVYALEPYFPAYQILLRNILLNGASNIIPLFLAVGDKNDFRAMFVKNWNYRGNQILDESGNIPVIAFDLLLDLLEPIHFIKMDIEGLELKIFQNSKRIFEYPIALEGHKHKSDLVSILREKGVPFKVNHLIYTFPGERS